jgi:uncharacterized protein YjbI with pentapeptide repeats
MKGILTSALYLSLSLAAVADTLSGEATKAQLLATGDCPACDLREVDLSGQELIGANLVGANLSGANLNNTNLRGANLQGATMLRLKLSDTALAGANLKQADLSDLDIDLVFEYVEIIGTQFEGARFKYGIVCGPPPNKGGWGCQEL